MPQSAVLLPFAFTLFVWWFSTGAILYLDGLPPRTYRWSLLGATAVLAAALKTLHATAGDSNVGGFYAAFTAAILVWGWIEMSFLMGFITGPRTSECPPGRTGWRRARYAIEAILYHELALIAGALLIATITHAGANRLGLETFAVLWFARLSTKLNLFLGVRNLSAELLPMHLRYLQSYFRRRRLNALFPFSVLVGSVAAAFFWSAAFASDSQAEATALSFLATLVTLALLEHAFLVLPIEANALWEWSLRARPAAERARAATHARDDAKVPSKLDRAHSIP